MLKNGYKVVKNFIAPSFADYLKMQKKNYMTKIYQTKTVQFVFIL